MLAKSVKTLYRTNNFFRISPATHNLANSTRIDFLSPARFWRLLEFVEHALHVVRIQFRAQA